jgi:hypothetical protein
MLRLYYEAIETGGGYADGLWWYLRATYSLCYFYLFYAVILSASLYYALNL